MVGVTLADLAQEAGGVPMRVGAGGVLFRPDDVCKGFVAVRRGVIRVGMSSANGREIILYRVRPGEICLQTFSCLAQGKAYAAEGVAEEAIEAFLLAPETFDLLLRDNPVFRRLVLTSIAARFNDYEGVVETLAFTGLEARLAGALLRLADPANVVRMTHEALAAEIGSAREAVSRQLGGFARDGLVSLSRGQILLAARDRLSRLAQSPT
ncbi:Crp/Fnr family transcriptional regulator [Terricaulis sp.]|uniref:Crp/Fnr family transcriptional regulator n=1 Tax=Terricaulis sp. TaxID=2768686 RepID=UPI003783FEB9